MAAGRRDLKAEIKRLVPLYKTGKPLSDPLAILVWENIGYLIDDESAARCSMNFASASD